ncbi:MAG: hypothetical protein ACYSWU_11985, partial [Planctomycetota bacterium]
MKTFAAVAAILTVALGAATTRTWAQTVACPGSVDLLWVGPHSTAWNDGSIVVTQIGISQFATQDLSGFDAIYVDTSAEGLSTLLARSGDIAAFVSAGGGLITENGGSFLAPDFSWVPNAAGLAWVFEVRQTVMLTTAGLTHPVTAGLTDAGLSNWSNSQHNHFSATAGMDVLVTNPRHAANILVGSFGAGRLVYLGVDPSYHQPVGQTEQLIRQAVAWAGTAVCVCDGVDCSELDTVCGTASCDPEGAAGNCDVLTPKSSGTLCRAATGACDATETCNGISSDCPADLMAAAGAPCGDPATTVCTDPDTCDGLGSCGVNNVACALVTASSLCPFDMEPDKGTCSGSTGGLLDGAPCSLGNGHTDCDGGTCEQSNQFRTLFTPDVQNWIAYKLNASNPGQYYYNLISEGVPGDSVTLTIEVPYPFVTQGAVPV